MQERIRYVVTFVLAILMVLPLLLFSTLAIPLSIFWTILSILFIILVLLSGKTIEFNGVDWVISIFMLYMVSSSLLHGNQFGSSQYYLAPIICCLYPVLKYCFQHLNLDNAIQWILLLCAGLEVGWGLLQMMGILQNSDSSFILGGTFGNPGIYSAYLSLLAPFLLTHLFHLNKANRENVYLTYLVVFILLTFLVIVSFSRGAWLAYLAGCGLVIAKHFGYKPKCNVILPIFLVGLFILYYLKKDSADGRLLIWKITVNAPHPNWIFGEGIGAFRNLYSQWQSEYFNLGLFTDHDWYIADYVTNAYNEFLHLFVEQGIIGSCLFIIVLMAVFRINEDSLSTISSAAKASLVSMVLLMLVSYPFDYLPTSLHLVLICAILNKHKECNISTKFS